MTVAPEGNLAARLQDIERIEQSLLEECRQLMSPRDMQLSDMFLLGAVKRSLALGLGFRQMIEARNFTCAAPILRLQLDTALRVSALALVDDVEDFARAVVDGRLLNKLKTRDGETLTDKLLVRKLNASFSWVEQVYEESSSFVHLSGKAIFTSVAKLDEHAKTVYLQISATDPLRDGEKKYFEAADAFIKAIDLTKFLILSHCA